MTEKIENDSVAEVEVSLFMLGTVLRRIDLSFTKLGEKSKQWQVVLISNQQL